MLKFESKYDESYQPKRGGVVLDKMSMETLEFIIYPDGRVREKVTGIVGASCQEVTAAIEAHLGKVVSQEKTSEYFVQPAGQTTATTNQINYNHW